MKRVLLIGGTGTLGSYAATELLTMGYRVDCIARRDMMVYNRNYTYIQGTATDELLEQLFEKTRYDCIVDFNEYPDWKAYPKRGELLLKNTDQLIFLSSYRVYADCQHPITEDAPQLYKVVEDQKFLEEETYAIPKSHEEDYLRGSGYSNWTIVRPVISFSHFRFDLITQSSMVMLPRILQHKKVLLPECCRDVVAGVCWAGNVGKMLARLCCNEKALGEAYTLGTGEKYTWGEVANMYTEVTGLEFEWTDIETYLSVATRRRYMDRCILLYDRIWDRTVDNSKVMEATGMRSEDVVGIKEGLIREFQMMMDRPDIYARTDTDYAKEVNARLDVYFAEKETECDKN